MVTAMLRELASILLFEVAVAIGIHCCAAMLPVKPESFMTVSRRFRCGDLPAFAEFANFLGEVVVAECGIRIA